MEVDGEQIDHSSHHGASHHGAGGGGHSMSMAFHTGISETILFETWKTETVGGLVGSCVVVFIIGLLFEGLKCFREYLVRREPSAEPVSCFCMRSPRRPVISESGEHVGKVRVITGRSWGSAIWNPAHLVQTLLHVLQFIVGYSLMLIFMTYNIWLCLAVVLGIGSGYLFFGWDQNISEPSGQNGDCCH